MKGFSHFMSGVAVASFGPWAVDAALRGDPTFFVLGGACGLLPDTLDFKFYRFFYKHDVYVSPDPKDPDPRKIAGEVARAVAIGVREKRPVRLKLGTVRLGADFWRRYRVAFDNVAREVVCRLGPVVNTGQVPVEGTEDPGAVGRAPLPAPVVQTYDADLVADIFDGPSVGFVPRADGGFDLEFLPWHREWSHALTVGLFLGLLWALVSCCFGAWTLAWQGLATIAGCYAVHVLEDQLGHMGSNLFWPFTRRRTSGLRLMPSGDALPNFTAVWISCVLIFWNLSRRQPALEHPFPFWKLVLVAVVVPYAVFGLLRLALDRGRKPSAPVGDDADDEWNEMKAS